MKKKDIFKQLNFLLSIWFAIFSGFWVVFKPLGGIDYLIGITNQKMLFYIISIFISLLISAIFTAFKYVENPFGFNKNTLGETRSDLNYIDFINDARKLVDLIGFSLPSFVLEGALDKFKELISKGVTIRIILINPISPSLSQRPLSLYKINPNIRDACLTSLETFIKFRRYGLEEKHKTNFKISLINILPSIGMVATDTKVLWSPYLSTKTGTASPYLLHEMDENKFGEMIYAHFDELWQHHSLRITDSTTSKDIVSFLETDEKVISSVDDEFMKKLSSIFNE